MNNHRRATRAVITKLGFFGHGHRLAFSFGSLLISNGGGGAGERVVVPVLSKSYMSENEDYNAAYKRREGERLGRRKTRRKVNYQKGGKEGRGRIEKVANVRQHTGTKTRVHTACNVPVSNVSNVNKSGRAAKGNKCRERKEGRKKGSQPIRVDQAHCSVLPMTAHLAAPQSDATDTPTRQATYPPQEPKRTNQITPFAYKPAERHEERGRPMHQACPGTVIPAGMQGPNSTDRFR